VSGAAVGVLPTDPTDPLYTSTVVADGTGFVTFSVDPFHVSSPGDITGDGRADLLSCTSWGVAILASEDLFPD
jgi:hypothetical protein